MKNKKCEDNFPEVGRAQKNKVENTVNFRTVSDMTVMFEQNLKKEDNTQRIQRITTGRQHRQGDSEKSEDNIDNFVEAQDQILEDSSNLNHKAKRLKCNLKEQLLGQEMGNLCETNCEPEKL